MAKLHFVASENDNTKGLFIIPSQTTENWGWARMRQTTVQRSMGVAFKHERYALYRGPLDILQADYDEFKTTGMDGRIVVQEFTQDTMPDYILNMLNIASEKNPNGLTMEEALAKKGAKKFISKGMSQEQKDVAPSFKVNGKDIYRFDICDFDCSMQDIKLEYTNVEEIEAFKKTVAGTTSAPVSTSNKAQKATL